MFTDDEQVTQQVALVAQLHTADPHIKESFTMLISFWQEQQLTLLFTITATTLSLYLGREIVHKQGGEKKRLEGVAGGRVGVQSRQQDEWDTGSGR